MLRFLQCLRRGLLPALCGLLLLGAGAARAATGPLVDAAWLRQALASAQPPLVLDASPTPMHAAGHIPGAISADFYRYGARELDAAGMQARLRNWGLGEGERLIVIHDQGGAMMAPWIFYELYRHGVAPERLRLLDGGLAAWKAAQGPLSTEPTPAPPAGDLRVTTLREEARARLPEFLAGSGDPQGHALLEALDPPYYYGGAKFFNRGGHVPHAKLTPVSDFFGPDKRFKPRAELQAMLDHLGVRREQQVYSYCGGGVAASVPFFALKFLLDYPRVALYQGSQKEWLQDPRGLPLWSYADPALLRDADWLNGFSNTMLRSYSHSPISIIDVRPPAAYAQGHIPFALSLPAELFEQAAGQPEGLAALLGPAGVDRAHEAVIVSEGGLDKRAALAFALLEQLGQQRVSLLLASVDDWALQGRPLLKEATRVAPKRSALDPSIEPVSYQPVPRALPRPAAPALPLIHLALGERAPSVAAPARLVHLPYAELLDAAGRPRPAHEIWSRLDKAGLPRHARIITSGDDAGEAAIGYVLLRLMGHADVSLARR
jgi:3-mercaptopyruvate sulfurtransferase SseA